MCIDHKHPKWIKLGEKKLKYILGYAGKERKDVRAPVITANECIALADVLTGLVEDAWKYRSLCD